jgi:hypothetical protein
MPRTARYTEEQVRDAIGESRSMSEALRRLGLRAAGGNHRTLKKLIERYELSTDHFDPYWSVRGPRHEIATPLADILVEPSTYHRNRLKRRLYDAGLKQRRCEVCGQGEEWQGQQMALILDHINGVADDNRLGNLQIVCPNCAATLATHCGRKNRRDRTPRSCLIGRKYGVSDKAVRKWIRWYEYQREMAEWREQEERAKKRAA